MRAVLLLLLLLALAAAEYQRPEPELWVEVHDLSPGYRLEMIEKALDMLHGRGRVVLLVIPARGNEERISEHPEFVSFLKEQLRMGAVLGMHGYTHEGFEFFTSAEEAERRVLAGREELRRAGLEAELFYPPRYLVTPWSEAVLEREFEEVDFFTGVVRRGRRLPYMSHDFTTPVFQEVFFRMSELSLLLGRSEVYRLSIHPAYLDERALQRLRELLELGGFESRKCSYSVQELRGIAEELEPPAELRGTKRKAYALLYHLNMYSAGGGRRHLQAASELADELLRERRWWGWGEEAGVPESSYSLLETSAAVWALSEAYLKGAARGREKEVLAGGDALLRKLELLTFFSYSFGLKPNAIGYAALALERASAAAEAMGEHERAERYRRKAEEVAKGLQRMQERSGAWRDGPYRLAKNWRRISTAYQSMALSGMLAGYAATPPGERGRLRAGVLSGIGFFRELESSRGYYAVLHPNGTLSGDGTAMALQGFAIAESYGFPAPCVPVEALSAQRWDPNLAFAVSRLLELSAPRSQDPWRSG
ncbi:MAG: DUF2334 domain-containing protein [Euryarchaeota archaeon]|nr:DUF2334 domain-containing protein [Euryarchaeota archaeon]